MLQMIITSAEWSNWCRLSMQMTANELCLDRESMLIVLQHDFGMKKMCAKLVTKILQEDQKQCEVKFSEGMWELIRINQDILDQVITED